MSSSASSAAASPQPEKNEEPLQDVVVGGSAVGMVDSKLRGNVSESEEEEEEEEAEAAAAAADDASSDSPATSSNEEEMQAGQESSANWTAEARSSMAAEEMEVDAMEDEDEEAHIGRKRRTEQNIDDDDDDDEIFAQDDEDDRPRAQDNEHLVQDDEEEVQHREQDEDEGDEQRHISTLGEDDEDEAEEESVGPMRIDLEVARCRASLGEEGPYFMKMPNFLNLFSKQFDPETYEDELEEDEVLDEEGRTRLKVKMENTIRWRTVRDAQGNEKRESNAKIVRWSDGSMSLYLGKEIFEIERQRLMDHNHLYTRQGAALQAQAIFGEKLIFRPHSTETMTHRKMTLNMAEKTSKTQKVKVLAQVGDNPEAERKELIRTEEEKLRAATRREAQQRRIRERPRMAGLTSGFLEGYESDEGGESLAAIKRRYQHAPYSAQDSRSVAGGGASSDESAQEEERERRARKAINEAKIYSDDEEEEAGAVQGDAAGDNSETEQQPRSRQQPQQKKKIVIEEDDDED
uniref:RNA polymerase-associated protein LEO1 n=1 Tax=Globodera rostochiensis TaxID=31243 RepID=A0A914HUH7_GLORO